MNLIDTATLFIALVTLSLVPSASVALVVARSLSSGIGHGAAVAAGIVLGDLVFLLLAVLGMAALAEIMGSLFLVLRYAAGAYLIWFGFNMMKSKPSILPTTSADSSAKYSASFLAGFFLTLGDVKAIFFYASLLPAIVDLSLINSADIVIIAFTTLVSVGGIKLGYAYLARFIVGLYAGHARTGRVVTCTAGGCMAGVGTCLIIKA